MITVLKKLSITGGIVGLMLTMMAGCSSINASPAIKNQNYTVQAVSTSEVTASMTPEASSATQKPAVSTQKETGSQNKNSSIVYTNTQYGFSFTLPESWKGYTIVNSKWTGWTTDTNNNKIDVSGPMLSIRHPQWTSANPRQDIPIMVLTLAQFDQAQKEKLLIGAGPINPSELARNATYVFALPARYNFAFPTGYQEVESILAGNPLKPNK